MSYNLPLSTTLASLVVTNARRAALDGEIIDQKTMDLVAFAEQIIMDDEILKGMLPAALLVG